MSTPRSTCVPGSIARDFSVIEADLLASPRYDQVTLGAPDVGYGADPEPVLVALADYLGATVKHQEFDAVLRDGEAIYWYRFDYVGGPEFHGASRAAVVAEALLGLA